ncbi:alpha/beta hydrolase [Simiduia sp. 21SJ11W-1]|uniref:alpha/beta fold hydrolase n=1 Tax=Simiduia sp. 21SJ11W-1 TaxID=2909669 RepID=UPI00209DDA75|nr:alpha/beta hydrolase [Simiduia sp. 21SJ11W-1]UTA47052.1 alpha/beta hydrolase [Simiduia sp. 21SJ11W-1]
MKPAHLYFVPGTQCDEQLWHGLWPLLAPHECTHLSIPLANSIDEMVAGLLAQLPEAPVALIGFSLGGYLSARLATQYPARVSRLLVCANSACALPAAEVRGREQLVQAIKRLGYRGLNNQKIAQMVGPSNIGRPEISACMKAMDARLGAGHLLNQLAATSKREDLLGALAGFTQPLALCFGEQDALVSKAWVARLVEARPATKVYSVENCGHMLPLEQPQALANVVQAWLGAHR